MNNWTFDYSDQFKKAFAKLDKPIQVMILAWIDKHLINVSDPRLYGKPLTGRLKGLWRYRIGSYHLLCEIIDHTFIIRFISIGHRKEIYK